jgi:protein-histidine pros-kinase
MNRSGESERLHARFGGLLEAAPDAILIVDTDGRIVLVNSAAGSVFGYAPAKLPGRSVDDLVPERFRAVHPHHRSGYVRDPRRRPMGAGLVLYGRRRDGSEFPAEISLSSIEVDGRSLTIAAIRDVSDRMALADRLRRQNAELEEQYRRAQEASRLKSEFLANMSHELRTPLNAIIGFAEMMHDGKLGPVSSDHKEFLGDILSSARHLLQLIDGTLDLAKVGSGRMEFRPEPLDVGRLVTEVRDILRNLESSTGVPISVEVAPSLGEVVADSAKLKQVLYNYLSNALKFTPPGGRVKIRVGPEGEGRFRLEIEDTGIGIKPEDLGRLFVEFQQLDAGTAKKYAGTGLGLALTKRIVEAQGGEVGVRSVPGQGSTFFAVLPRGPSSEASGGPVSPAREARDGR